MTKAEHAERWAASIHEASHAVIHALHYRDRIRLMALDSGGRGVTRALTTRGESDPVKAAICCLAGAAGEHLLWRAVVPPCRRHRSTSCRESTTWHRVRA